MRKLLAAGAALVMMLVAGCGQSSEDAARSSSAAMSESIKARVEANLARASEMATWVPSGWSTDDAGTVAYDWDPDKDLRGCAKYQDSCFVALVKARYGCPRGVYVGIAIQDDDGLVIGDTNDITAPLTANQTARVPLEMPGGNPSGAQARFAKVQCLG